MRLLHILVGILLLVGVAGAVPAGTAVTLVGNNNATFSATSALTHAWFQYGMERDTLVVWTQNITAGGAYTWTETGSPLSSGETYYVAGCDDSGCGTPVMFKLLDATPLPYTTYGNLYTNGTQSKFNILGMITYMPAAYTWLLPQANSAMLLSIVAGIVFFAIFYGLAARTRYVAVPVLVGMVVAPYLLYQQAGLHLGIPPEFQIIAQGLTYLAMAGVLILIMKK